MNVRPSENHRKNRVSAEKRGRRGEILATIALLLKGYRMKERRYKTKLGEVDIIARKGDLVIMVEVKARASLSAALDSVSVTAQRRIAAAGDIWLGTQSDVNRLSVRYDVVAIVPKRWPIHVENVW